MAAEVIHMLHISGHYHCSDHNEILACNDLPLEQ